MANVAMVTETYWATISEYEDMRVIVCPSRNPNEDCIYIYALRIFFTPAFIAAMEGNWVGEDDSQVIIMRIDGTPDLTISRGPAIRHLEFIEDTEVFPFDNGEVRTHYHSVVVDGETFMLGRRTDANEWLMEVPGTWVLDDPMPAPPKGERDMADRIERMLRARRGDGA